MSEVADNQVATLLDRLRETTAALEAARAEIDTLTHCISHDLRAPLAVVDGFSQMLEEEEAAALGDRGQFGLRRIRTATQQMSTQIDGLLGMARIARHVLRRETVDLGAIAHATLAEFGSADPGREMEVKVATGLLAHGDRCLLEQLVTHLLDNAWKFTSKQARARIEIGKQTDSQGQVVFFVADNGAGFDMKYADKLFRPFQRLHKTDEFPGTGIGLATARRIVERHDGRMWALSPPGAGAIFYFTVPSPSP